MPPCCHKMVLTLGPANTKEHMIFMANFLRNVPFSSGWKLLINLRISGIPPEVTNSCYPFMLSLVRKKINLSMSENNSSDLAPQFSRWRELLMIWFMSKCWMSVGSWHKYLNILTVRHTMLGASTYFRNSVSIWETGALQKFYLTYLSSLLENIMSKSRASYIKNDYFYYAILHDALCLFWHSLGRLIKVVHHYHQSITY